MDNVTISRQGGGDAGEYIAHVHGSPKVGRLLWTQEGTVRSANSTQVPQELGGRGIAARLVEALIGDARAEGFMVQPACSYVEAAFAKHPDWADIKA